MALLAHKAGSYKLRILLFPDTSLQRETRMVEVLREATLRVVEARASSARSFLASFWPPQGPVAGLPAGFFIQVWITLSSHAFTSYSHHMRIYAWHTHLHIFK